MYARLLLAAALAGGIAVWMASGDVIVAGSAETAATPPPAARENADATPFAVRVETISAEERRRTLVMRGRTRADQLVNVAAETPGRVEERVVDRGTRVQPGDLLCRLDEGVRAAQLAQARAEAAKAQLEFDAASSLRGRGFESQTRVAATRAALDAADAAVAAAEQELERTNVRAPLAGSVQEPLANIGSTLAMGETCATIVDADPIIVTGQVSERDIRSIALGVEATVRLVTGETRTGTVTFVSRTSDPDTRTFTVEITVPNPDETLRDGVTTEADIPLTPVTAHRVPPGVLTLADSGALGVRSVGPDNKVAFNEVRIVGQDRDGFWVSGLPQTITVIVVGQDYVVEGQTVTPVAQNAAGSAPTDALPAADAPAAGSDAAPSAEGAVTSSSAQGADAVTSSSAQGAGAGEDA